jgi:hypothetical protein
MSKKTAQVTLGDFAFTAHKFNLGETEEIVELQDGMGSATTRVRLSAMRGIVLIAAQRDNPDLTDEDMRKIEATPNELIQAVNAILRLNGYAKEVGRAGEDEAADQAA